MNENDIEKFDQSASKVTIVCTMPYERSNIESDKNIDLDRIIVEKRKEKKKVKIKIKPEEESNHDNCQMF